MDALWVCLHEELGESNWNDPNLFSPSGLPGRAVRREKLFESDKSCGQWKRHFVPWSCVHWVPSRDERLLASEGKLKRKKGTSAR